MKRERIMRMIIGTMITVSALLTFFHSIWWVIFTVFIGLNMFQFGITNFCLLKTILTKLGIGDD